MRRIASLAAAGALVGIFSLAPGASANCTDQTPAENHGASEINVTNPATGGHVYASQPGGTGGYIGTHGGTGYIEAYGDATTQSGAIEGSTSDGAVNGSISGSGVCVNDTRVP